MPLSIRAAVASDAPRVADVLVESRKAFMPFAPSAHTDGQMHEWVRDVLLPDQQVTVAIADGVVAGVIATSIGSDASWIEQLYVHPSHVGQGIGSTLLAQAMTKIPFPVRLYTFQEHERARNFYKRHGFVAIEFTDGSTNEERCPDVLYERRE